MNEFLKKQELSYIVDNDTTTKQSFLEDYPQFEFIYDVIEKHGGAVFERGMLKIHTFGYVKKWTELIAHKYFRDELAEQNKHDIICFASNWQGCMYCINSTNDEVVYFDPATVEFFRAEGISIDSFFDDILINGEYDILAEEYFQEVCAYFEIDKLEYEDSFGHKIYLHLGGEDDVENYEIVDTEILWDLQMQVAERINEIG